VQEAHVRSIEISKKDELSIQLGPGRSFIGPSLGVLALTLALAEALAASELLANARDTPLPRPRSYSLSSPTFASHVTPLQAFPCTSSIPLAGRAPSITCFIRDGVTTK
jgi:hypothetical protein